MNNSLIEKLDERKLAAYFDHTMLKPFADDTSMKKICDEAAVYGFKMVAINPAQVKRCKAYLQGTNVHVGAAVSFPLGQETLEVKLFETENAIACGSDEIDYVINISAVKNENWNYIRKEMEAITEICRYNDIISKVIFENCYLTNEEIRHLAEIAREVKPDFIKTSTGFGNGGATVADVTLMKKIAGPEVSVKAAGGIRNLEECLAMIEAGAGRIGTSASVNIMKEFISEKNKLICCENKY